MAFIGCRRGEVLDLRWRHIGDGAIVLQDSKVDPRTVPLGGAAPAVVEALPGPTPRTPSSSRRTPGGSRRPTSSRAGAVCREAGLGRLRPHDLRHAEASHAVMSGENRPSVRKPLGHRGHSTTAGHAHLIDFHLVESAEKAGSIIAEPYHRLPVAQSAAGMAAGNEWRWSRTRVKDWMTNPYSLLSATVPMGTPSIRRSTRDVGDSQHGLFGSNAHCRFSHNGQNHLGRFRRRSFQLKPAHQYNLTP